MSANTSNQAKAAYKYSEKALQILKSTQKLIQENGYNGFSFRDVAEKVGIQSASIHYHFPTKSELVKAATIIYRQHFGTTLKSIENKVQSASSRLAHYAALFENSLEGNRVCLCGMLASDTAALPREVRPEVDRFFKEQTLWLTRIIMQGQKNGELRANLNAKHLAFTYLSTLEGAIILAYSLNTPAKLKQSSGQFIAMCKMV